MPVVIENPILNSAYLEPSRHFRFDDDGITEDIIDCRRPSSYFVPIPAARRRGGQQAFDTEWTRDRVEENDVTNRIRAEIDRWRSQGHPGVSHTTRYLLSHWRDPERDNRLFFCQVEAAETAIYLAEAAPKLGGQWILNHLREDAERHNPGLFRVAHKMATGTGKTVVMAMLIAWQTLNKVAEPARRPFHRHILGRDAGNHDPRPPASAPPLRPGQLLPRVVTSFLLTSLSSSAERPDRDHEFPRLLDERDRDREGLQAHEGTARPTATDRARLPRRPLRSSTVSPANSGANARSSS